MRIYTESTQFWFRQICDLIQAFESLNQDMQFYFEIVYLLLIYSLTFCNKPLKNFQLSWHKVFLNFFYQLFMQYLQTLYYFRILCWFKYPFFIAVLWLLHTHSQFKISTVSSIGSITGRIRKTIYSGSQCNNSIFHPLLRRIV